MDHPAHLSWSHQQYIQKHWDSLDTFLNVYIPMDQSMRTSDVQHGNVTNWQLSLNRAFPQCAVQAGKTAEDFTLTRFGQPTVQVHVKQGTDNVHMADVLRVEHDVHTHNRHAIMISNNAGIVDRGNFSFTIVKQRYVALYLSHMSSDMPRLQAAVDVVYALDSMLRDASGQGSVAFTQDMMDALSADIMQYDQRIQQTMQHLEQAKSVLNSIMLDSIRSKLAAGLQVQSKDTPVEGQCSFCKEQRKSWMNTSNLNAHVKTCTAKLLIEDRERFRQKQQSAVDEPK